MESSSDSVFQLVTHLCQSLCNDYNKERVFGPPLGEAAVKRWRNQAFEILLHKSAVHPEDVSQSSLDALREIQFHQFDMRQNAKTTGDKDRCERLEKCIETLLAENCFFRTDVGQSVLMLLMLLKNSSLVDEDNIRKTNNYYPFGFFTSMRSCTETNPYICISEEMCGLPKMFDLDVDNQYRQFNPYMPNPYIFVVPSDPSYEQLDYFFKLNFEVPAKAKRPSYTLPAIGAPPKISPPVAEEISSGTEIDVPTGPVAMSWINLGKPAAEVKPERPFITEVPYATYHLMNLLKRTGGEEYSLKIMPEQYYLMNLKYLCTGVQSDSFVFDEENVSFASRETGITVGQMAPSTLIAINKRFIDFGTCFKRLELATSVIPDALIMPVEGFVYKALSKAVNQFLFSIRHFIFNGPTNETILQFSMRTRQFSEIIGFFATVFQIHPESNQVERMPKGSRLLIYLYEILVDEMTKQDKVVPIVTVIRDCCQAYYQLFQQWIFNGILTDPYSELFINYTDQYKLQTKYYFDKSFYLSGAEVPPFLKGFEQDLLLCGKYTMLLREYKPNHRIFSITNAPIIRICLTYEAIQGVKDVCGEYLMNGYRCCGGRISVREIFKDMRERKDRLKKTVSMRFKENLIRWQDEMERKQEALVNLQKTRREELLQQIEEKKFNTLERRKAEIELERECEVYDRKLEQMELAKVAEDRKRRIEYYEELNEIANEKKGAMDEALHELEGELKELRATKAKVQEDTCNENYKREVAESLDRLNANSEQFQKNKEKVLGSQLTDFVDKRFVVDVPKVAATTSERTMTEAQRNKMKILSEEFDLKNYDNCDNKDQAIVEMGKKILTEAQKNKIKVLAHEFNNNNNIDAADPIDEDQIVLVEKAEEISEGRRNKIANLGHQSISASGSGDTQSKEPISEMQRNRLKIMSHEFGINVPMDAALASEINEETMTELQKNRRRILFGNVTAGSEVHLPLELNPAAEREKNKRKFFESELGQQLSVPVVPVIPSPMSTTSDPGDEKSGKVIDTEDIQGEEEEKEDKEEGDRIRDPIEFIVGEEQQEPQVKPQTIMEFLLPLVGLDVTNVFEENSQEDDSGVRRQLKKSDLKKITSLNFETVNQLLQQSLTIPLKTQLELMNNEILKMYLLDLDIYSHFKSLRNYFFLMDGEFGIHICEGLISALEAGIRPARLYSYQTLNTALEQAFGASVSGKDKNGSRLSFAMVKNIPANEFNLLSPNVLEDLELTYQLEWPLNLILCPKAIHQYSTVFQYLLKVRRIGWVLENSAYMSLKISAKTLSQDLLTSPQYRHVQLVRHKFSQFVNCLRNHISSSAIQSSWKRFKDDLLTVKSMADLYRVHSNYIKQIRFLCMLNRTSQEFQKRINDIFSIILRFNNHLNSVAEPRWEIAGEDAVEVRSAVVNHKRRTIRSIYVHPNYEKMCRDEKDFDKCCNYVMYLGEKIVRRGYQVELNEFLNLVNVNGFYKGVQPGSVGESGADGNSSRSHQRKK